MRHGILASLLAATPALALACSGSPPTPDVQSPPDAADVASDRPQAMEAGTDVVLPDAPGTDAADVVPGDVVDDVPLGPTWCSMGTDVPGAAVPAGFCMREFARIGSPRVMAFASNGDLFVAAPSQFTAGGAPPGPGIIAVFSDDNHDGVGEQQTFLDQQPNVHGITLSGGYLYFTGGGDIERVPYTLGQRSSTATGETVATFSAGSRWTHGLSATPRGSIFGTESTNGGGFSCDMTPLTGAVSHLEAGGMLNPFARGFRNPMYVRCHFRDEVCAASELGEDLATGAREKILVVRPNTNYGYPCCYTQGAHATGQNATYNCDAVAREDAAITLGDTPFGLDWERGAWPSQFQGALFVALHGTFYASPGPGVNSRIVYSPADPTTHVPTGAWVDFITGFGPTGVVLRRASDVLFAPDGRMFVADDTGGRIFWVAPTTLRAPAH
jgi:glucose/arabinose dehydrogenase